MMTFEKIPIIALIIALLGGIYYLQVTTNEYNQLAERYNSLAERHNRLLNKTELLSEKAAAQETEIKSKDAAITFLNKSNQWYAANTVSKENYVSLGAERDDALYNQRTVVVPEVIRLGDYNLKWLTKCRFNRLSDFSAVLNDNGREDCVGWTDNERNIYIMNGETIEDIITVCTHEILHNLIDINNLEIEENIVEQLDKKVMLNECLSLENKVRY